MTHKIFLLVGLNLICFAAKSQNLLGADSVFIKKQMIAKGAVFLKSLTDHGSTLKNDYREMIFLFPKNKSKNGGILDMTFDMTMDDKCFRYHSNFYGENWLTKFKDSLDSPSSGLKRVKDSLKWIDVNKRYQVQIIKYSGGIYQKYPIYFFEVKRTNPE